MGWFSDLIDWIADILDSIFKFIENLVEGLVNFIAGFLDSFWGVLGLLLLTFATAGIAAAIFAALKAGGIIAALTSVINAVTAAIGSIAGILRISFWIGLGRFLYFFSPTYRNEIDKLRRGVMKLSAALGYGVHFIQHMLFASKAIVYGSMSLFGVENGPKEFEFIQRQIEVLQRIEDKFNDYALRPELLIRDIEKYILEPYSESSSKLMFTLLSAVDGIAVKLDTSIGKFDKLNMEFGSFINSFPADVDVRIKNDWVAWNTRWDGFYLGEWQPGFALHQSELDLHGQRLGRNEMKQAGTEERLEHPGVYLSEMEEDPESIRFAQEDYINDVANRPTERQVAKSDPALENEERANRDIIDGGFTPPPTPALLQLEPSSYKTPSIGKQAPRKTWFVGDY